MKIQILFVIISVFFALTITFYILDNLTIENYDEKITKISQRQCGNMCTNALGCYSFGYKNNGDCYLSKTHTLGQLTDGLYSDDYDASDYRCNKFRPI